MAIANGAWVILTRTEADILETIRQDEPIAANDIALKISGLWGQQKDANCIRVHIHNLRPKLETIGLYIGHIKQRGYILVT